MCAKSFCRFALALNHCGYSANLVIRGHLQAFLLVNEPLLPGDASMMVEVPVSSSVPIWLAVLGQGCLPAICMSQDCAPRGINSKA